MRFVLLILCLCLPLQATAQSAQPDMAQVMKAVRADEWEMARTLARPQGQVASDIVEWRYLRAGEGTFEQYRDFLARNGDWPGLDRVRARGEGAIPPDATPQEVVAWFKDAPPVTGYGGLRLTQAYAALGRTGDAQAQAVLTWRTLPLSAPAQAELLKAYGPLLAPHHIARLDALLWQGADDSVRLMLPLVPEGWRTLAVARMTLRAQGPNVDKLIEAVPGDLADNAGLAYERFNWRARKGRDDDAIALLDERSLSVARLGQPARWARWRRSFARSLMRDGKAELAYQLAANHFLAEGSDYADLEWLAGFIALRQLEEPETALTHFQRLQAAVKTPISLGRAFYWQGRALEALGRADAAQAAYVAGARYQTSFYGQLAAEKAGIPMDASLTGKEVYPDWTTAPFVSSSVLRAGLMLLQGGERNLAAYFLTHLAKRIDATQQAQLAGLALSLDEPHIALKIAKVAAAQGNVMPRAYFPLTDLTQTDHPVPDELVLSIARRESEFNPAAASGAGARGLMQLMPGTAEAVAAKLELEFSNAALLEDPAFNAKLGAAYLAGLVEEFGDNYVLVAAAYNAGPSRPRAWIAAQGDPRSAGVDVVDWIEMIPFNETRNYVMRVTESLAVYRARLSGKVMPMRLAEDLKGS